MYQQKDPDNMNALWVTFLKNTSLFLNILQQRIQDNISFEMNLVSRLTATDCASGNHVNLDIAKFLTP